MAKILVSLLGTGKSAKNDDNKNEYQGTDYYINNIVYKDEKFVANPIIKHYGVNTVFFIGTKSSMWDNINENFEGSENFTLELIEQKENKKLDEEILKKLNETINTYLNSSKSKCFIIEDGESEEELWQIFDKFIEILSYIETDDEVYFDITHLFRSLSVMTFVMTEFAKTYKQFKLSGMFYGMLKTNEPSIIIDLRVFFELLDWSKAILNLKKFGNSYDLKQLIGSLDEDKIFKNAFNNFSNALSISDVGAMQSSIKILKGKLVLFEQNDSHIIKLLSNDLKDFIKRFDIESLGLFQFELAKWYGENKNYAFAYITLAEACVSIVCEKNKLDATSEDDRKEGKQIIWNYRFSESGSKDKEKIYTSWDKVNNIRNNIAHKLADDGRRTKIQPNDSINNLEVYIKTLAILFKQ